LYIRNISVIIGAVQSGLKAVVETECAQSTPELRNCQTLF